MVLEGCDAAAVGCDDEGCLSAALEVVFVFVAAAAGAVGFRIRSAVSSFSVAAIGSVGSDVVCVEADVSVSSRCGDGCCFLLRHLCLGFPGVLGCFTPGGPREDQQ